MKWVGLDHSDDDDDDDDNDDGGDDRGRKIEKKHLHVAKNQAVGEIERMGENGREWERMGENGRAVV